MLKRLAAYFHNYRRELAGSVLCVAMEAVFELVIPILMADIIDIGIPNRDKSYVLEKGAAMAGCALVALALGVLYAHLSARAGQGFGAELRKAEYRKLQGFSFSNMDHFSVPSLITRLTNDITILQHAACAGLRPMVRGPVMMVMALAMSITMSPQLALVFLVAMPVLATCLVLILRKLGPMYAGMQKALDEVNAIVEENLRAIRTVKAYVKGDSEYQKFSGGNEAYQHMAERSFHYAVLNLPCFQAVMYATILCILWLGGNYIHQGTMKVGVLTGFLSYVLQILNSLMMISNVFLLLSRSITSAQRIFEVLDESAAIQDGPGSYTVHHGEIDFEDVSFKYQENAEEYVLSHISLHFGAGQTIGIIGGTGSAKSSLVQLIPRLYDVSEGTLKIDGHNVREYSLVHLRDAVGMVLQNNTLFSGTIRENLKWGNENATDADLDWACRIVCADEFLSRMPEGYDTDLGQGGVNVSGGQKQRLCIARAILKQPCVLIFDDSTSAVDTATEARIRHRLASELKDTTKIFITQRIRSIADADQIVVLDNGTIHAVGTHDELMKGSEIYRDIYEFQQKGVLE